ncbi:MAG: SDR family NAD(P)-dependent oxidoreductase, partial [Alphaproteobacteria bacterium]
MAFTFDDTPDLSGKVALITGANSGLGLETTKMLARKGARVIMACRNEQKATDAASQVRDAAPNAALDIRQVDLSDLASVEAFANGVLAEENKIDLIINNAGVFASRRSETAQGHELQFGTNHLGHFALNAKLLPLVEAADGGRIVVLGSMSHSMVKSYDTSDVDWQARPYDSMQAYAQSKLANMLYLLELNKRLQAAGSKVKAVMAHPGYSATNITESPDAHSNAFMGVL